MKFVNYTSSSKLLLLLLQLCEHVTCNRTFPDIVRTGRCRLTEWEGKTRLNYSCYELRERRTGKSNHNFFTSLETVCNLKFTYIRRTVIHTGVSLFTCECLKSLTCSGLPTDVDEIPVYLQFSDIMPFSYHLFLFICWILNCQIYRKHQEKIMSIQRCSNYQTMTASTS